MVERRDSWFQSEMYLTRIAIIMATIVEIRQGPSEGSPLRVKANLALERLGQLANGELKVEGNKVKWGELRPWSPRDNPRQAAIREVYEDHAKVYGEMPSNYPAEVWATIQACTFAEFLTEHPEALTLRVQRIEREMADPRRRLKGDISQQGYVPHMNSCATKALRRKNI